MKKELHRFVVSGLLSIILISVSYSQYQEELRLQGAISSFERENKPVVFAQRMLAEKPSKTIMNSFDDLRIIEVKFLDDIEIDISSQGQPVDKNGVRLSSNETYALLQQIQNSGGVWNRITEGMEGQVEGMRRSAEFNLNRAIANLNNYFILSVPEGINAEEWIDQLNSLDDVEIAEPRHLPPPLPVPDYQANQGYLNSATTGVDASYAWSMGDSGQSVTICDFEYAWNLNHIDLPSGIGKLIPPMYIEIGMTLADSNHGTAVLGELASRNNGWGTKGIAYGATIKVAPTWGLRIGSVMPLWFLDASMLYAMTQLKRGDIFLIEQQEIDPYFNGIDTGLVPVEWDGTIYNIVLTAVGNGFHVIEAGANGYRNLDSTIYNVNHAPFLPQNNSGAIIVGAGSAPPSLGGTDVARARLSFSNYGSRLNLQGWGDTVYTTGYGTRYGYRDSAYTGGFAGTSSASPIVAGAVALVESRFEMLYGREITPLTMRTILANTGSSQQSGFFPSTQKIGPLPNVRAAIDSFASSAMTLSGTYTVGIGGNYVNLTAVANELRQKVVTGNVIFEIQSTYIGMTESIPISFSEYTTRGGDWSVTIRPAAGVIKVLTYGRPPGHPYTTYPVIKLDGIDRLTLDGRPGGTGSTIEWVIRNTRTDSVGATVQFENDATNNVLTYLQIEGQNPTAYPGTVYFGGYSGNEGNSHNIVSHCEIRDRSDVFGLPAVGIYSDWTIGAANDSNSIVENNIYNWTSYGIYFYGERWVIKDNSFYEQFPQANTLTGIFMMGGNGHLISDNYIGGSASKAGGASLSVTASVTFTGIWLNVDTLQATSIQGNRISNIFCSSLINPNFYGISIATGNANVGTSKRNIIGDSTMAGSISVAGNGAVGGIIMNLISRNLVNIENNLIANIDQISVAPGELRGINIVGILECKIINNEIRNVGPSMPMAHGIVRGIYLLGSNDSVTVANNMITLGSPIMNNCNYSGIYSFGMWPRLSKIYNNSVYVWGISGGPVNTNCMEDAGNSIMNVKDNIFQNARAGGPGLNYTISAGVKPWIMPSSSDYNILYNVTSTNLVITLGMNMNLSQWQMATAGDMNSINLDPKFNNPAVGDLHMNPAVYSPSDNAGISIAEVGNDFDYEPRLSNPDIGADEYLINIPTSFSHIAPAKGSSNQPRSGALTWHPSPEAGKYDVYLDTLNPPVIKISSDRTDTNYSYSGLDTNKRYYWKTTAKNSSGNTDAAGSPWYFYTGAGSGEVTSDYSMMAGWNLISLPLMVSDNLVSSVYPTAVTSAFAFYGSYVSKDSIYNGSGYWIKFDSAQDVSVTGYAYGEDSIGINSGWNMIGSLSAAIPVDSITSIPGSIITSGFFAYSSGYQDIDTIKPGQGYWVKSSQEGLLVLRVSGAIFSANRIIIVPDSEMPPPPPGERPTAGNQAYPSDFGLDQNYPNPFNPRTVIDFRLLVDSYVKLGIYSMLGQEIVCLIDGYQKAGFRSIEFDGSALTTGVYTYRLSAGDQTISRKMVLIR